MDSHAPENKNVSDHLIDHESKGKYTNNHLLHVISGIANEEQLKNSIRGAINMAKEKNLPWKTLFKVNIVADRNGKLFGYAYVWITNPEFFYMMIGRNPDGSERYELIDDPDWSPEYGSSNWADMVDLEDPPKIRRALGPLINLPPYELTPEQKHQLSISNSGIKCIRGTHGVFECGPTYVTDVGPEYQPNVLCGKVPPEISIQDLKNLFIPFVSDSSQKFTRKVKGVMVTENYPLVTITSKQIAFITFNLSTHDAAFASKMARKIDLIKTDQKTKESKKYILVFNRAHNNRNNDSGNIKYFDQ